MTALTRFHRSRSGAVTAASRDFKSSSSTGRNASAYDLPQLKEIPLSRNVQRDSVSERSVRDIRAAWRGYSLARRFWSARHGARKGRQMRFAGGELFLSLKGALKRVFRIAERKQLRPDEQSRRFGFNTHTLGRVRLAGIVP